MLVLSRKIGESIVIDGQITVTVQEVRGNRVRISIDAPRDVPIVRAELNEFWLDAAPQSNKQPALV